MAEKNTIFIIIDTDSYSGNFEREMVSYVTGLYSEEQYHGKEEAESFREWAEDNGMDGYMFEAIVEETQHEEYGWRYSVMFATPGRLNNGTGQNFDAEPGQTGWPAYESVGFAVSRELTPEELRVVKQRAEEYGKLNRIKILGYRMQTQQTVSTTTEFSTGL